MTIPAIEERLARQLEKHKALCATEYHAEEILRPIRKMNLNCITESSISVYENTAFIYYRITDLVQFELNLSKLTDSQANLSSKEVKWSKYVQEHTVSYNLDGRRTIADQDFYWTIVCNHNPEPGSCLILARPTGRLHRVTKEVQVEEPEVEFYVDCKETENGTT